MPLRFKKGSVFLGGFSQKPHYWIVLTEPCASGEVAIINVTTLSSKTDNAVVLESSDHPNLTHDSVPAYEHAMILDISAQEIMKKPGANCPQKGVLAERFLIPIIAHAIESDQTPDAVKDFLKKFGI